VSILRRIKNKVNKYKLKATLMQRGNERSLYKTIYSDYYWLSEEPSAYVDKCIRESSVFEENSTKIVKTFIKRGDVVLDIGANIGYYSVIMSKLVGEKGKVVSFEPTRHYRDVLEKNIKINKLTNVQVYKFGLSNRKQELEISIGDSSATLHEPQETIINKKREMIQLYSLDECINELDIDRIDFIKIDVDGHESAFLEGAIKSIEQYNPIILLEVNHLNYIEDNVFAWEFYDDLINQSFHVYSEKNLNEFKNRTEFLKECANFAYSSNIVISRRELVNG